MDIQQLRYFNTVVHLENVSKAADSLHISQSALSKQIRGLENELGVSLFDRKGKKIILNKAGMRFYRSSEQILRELASASDDIQMLVARKNPRIRIGGTEMPARMLSCIFDFSALHPKAQFILNNRVDYEKSIDINQYDALICPDDFRYENLNGYPFYEESYFFAVHRSSDLAEEKVFSFHSIRSHPLVFLHGDDLSPEFPYSICSTADFEPGPLFFTDSREQHRWMIAEGKACGFVPSHLSESYLSCPEIRLLRVLDPRFARPFKICFLRERHLSELGLLFREHVIDYFKLEEKGVSHDISG